MLKRQANQVARAIQSAGLNTSEFAWKEENSKSSTSMIDVLIHKESGLYFKFDVSDGDVFGQNSSRIARYAPGTQHVSEYTTHTSWEGMFSSLKEWLKSLRQELGPDLWSENEPEEFEAWSDHDKNQDFKPNEIKKVYDGLERVETLLIKHSDKTEKTIKDINENIKFLKNTAMKSTKREFKYIFIGLIVNKLTDWAIKTITIQHIILVLVQNAKSIVSGN